MKLLAALLAVGSLEALLACSTRDGKLASRTDSYSGSPKAASEPNSWLVPGTVLRRRPSAATKVDSLPLTKGRPTSWQCQYFDRPENRYRPQKGVPLRMPLAVHISLRVCFQMRSRNHLRG